MIDYSQISENSEAFVPFAMREGWQAYLAGKSRADNPYNCLCLACVQYNEDWDNGWQEAQAAEEYQNDRTIT
ncbi:MAG: hypothetical protein M0R80_07840 [Proteobacteria bacterium]|jgi:ribosome modulation factor|nr:hypothetical protein [Pseudomonadota bacterium]